MIPEDGHGAVEEREESILAVTEGNIGVTGLLFRQVAG